MAGWDVVPSAKTVARATGLGLLTASALVAVQVISGLVRSNCYSAGVALKKCIPSGKLT